ncbi:MAG: hypothetical protein ABIT20_16125 [Gemmatimonadaceae bacterium]
MSAAERVFTLLLRAYPAQFRAAYGREMMVLFRDQRRAGERGARFWAECSWDVARSAPALRMESWQSWWQRSTHSTEGVVMRMTMAILSILIGAFELVNGLVEGRAAAATGLDGASIIVVALVVIAGVLLLAAGVAEATRSTRAPTLALGAAVTCLAVFVLIGLVLPRMSILSMMLGIGFPIVLLLFLRFGRGQPARMVA